MIYYRYLEINHFEKIKQKTYDFLNKFDLILTGFIELNWYGYCKLVPEVLTAFDRYGIKPVNAYVYIIFSPEQSFVHYDYLNESLPQCRVNIPILNCEGSKTEFYEDSKNYYVHTQKDGGKFYALNLDNIIKKDEVEIIRPTVIRVQKPHKVTMDPNKSPRISLTLSFDRDPIFLLEE